MATAEKRGSSWRVRVFAGKENGKPVYQSFTAPTKREAEALAADWALHRPERVNTTKTVGQAIDDYIETCRVTGMSPATIRGYTTSRKNAFWEIENTRLQALTLTQIQHQINSRAKNVSPKSVRNDYGLLTATLKLSRPDLNLSPIRLPKRQTIEVKIPTDEDVKLILSACLKDIKKERDLYLAVLFGALLGLRRSEICGLKWSDLKDHLLSVHEAKVRGEKGVIYSKGTKTKAGTRVLTVPDLVYDTILSYKNDDEYIVTSKPADITNHYERLLKKLKLSYRFHDLRHYHASTLLAVGAPIQYAARELGHSTTEMVSRVYGHIVLDRQRQINEQSAKHSNSILSGDDYWNADVTKNMTKQ